MAAPRASNEDHTNRNGDSKPQSVDYFQGVSEHQAVMQRTEAVLDLSLSKRFILPKPNNYAPQYAHIYFCRLKQLREQVDKSARAAFGKTSDTLRYVRSIVDAGADDVSSRDTVFCGIVFREMPGKPSILAQYEKPSPDHLIPDPPPRASAPFASKSDRVFLEDDNARCALDLSMLPHEVGKMLVTGLVIAVRGKENRTTGAFSVVAVASVDPAPQPPISKPTGSRRLVCLISAPGLTPVAPGHELLLDTLSGTIDAFNMESDDISSNRFGSSIVHTIIAGNLISPAPSVPLPHESVSSDDKNKLAAVLRDADAFLSALVAALPVSVMPGPDDATNTLLPQQPLHRCLLPGAARSKNLSRVPNPFVCTIDSIAFLGTSGQNVDDLALYDLTPTEGQTINDSTEATEGTFHANGERVLDIMELMINNRHLAPTCPDTLGVYPFTELDPFVLERTPHVMFVGNQKQFSTRLMKLPIRCEEEHEDSMTIDTVLTEKFVRLISIPRFDKTGQAVFVDLNTLECEVREFGLTI